MDENKLNKHGIAISLENILRMVHNNVSRGSFGGIICADHLEIYPFDATLIALSPLFNPRNESRISKFVGEWYSFAYSHEKPSLILLNKYKDDLRSLVNELVKEI